MEDDGYVCGEFAGSLGVADIFLIESCIAFITKLLPLSAPRHLSQRVRTLWLAISHLIAVGMPRGQSLVVYFGSLWRQISRRY